MRFLYEELAYHSDGGCGFSTIQKQDPDKKPLRDAVWDTFIFIENKYVNVTNRKSPRAILGDDGQPIIKWDEEKRYSDDWNTWLTDGFEHTRTEQPRGDEVWQRKVTRGGWFIEINTFDDFLDRFMNMSGFEIFISDKKYIGSEDKRFWIRVIRYGLMSDL